MTMFNFSQLKTGLVYRDKETKLHFKLIRKITAEKYVVAYKAEDGKLDIGQIAKTAWCDHNFILSHERWTDR